jgi:hypothetical protein
MLYIESVMCLVIRVQGSSFMLQASIPYQTQKPLLYNYMFG